MCVMLSNIDAIVLTCDLLYNHPQVVASFCPKCDRDGDNMRITAYYWGILDQPQPLKLKSRDVQKERSMVHTMGCWIMIGECTFALLRWLVPWNKR